MPETANVSRREALERALLEDVAVVSDVAQRIGQTFAAGHGLHDTDFRALSFLHASELQGRRVSPALLGSHLMLSSGAVTYLVDRLEAGGHVTRVRDPHDRRRVLLEYADPGRELAVAYFGPLTRRHRDALDGLSDDDLEATHRVLASVIEALRGHEEELRDDAGSRRRHSQARDRGQGD